jgi:hypothetical protein
MLLEVVLSLAILVTGLAFIGLQVNQSLQMAEKADLKTRAVMAAGSAVAELQSGVIVPEGMIDAEELSGDFGVIYPGFTWKAEFALTDVENLYMVIVQIGYNARLAREQIEDPEMEIDFEDEGTRIMREVYLLWPTPPDIDLERDFGLEQADLDKLTEEIPVPGFDPTSIDPVTIAQLDAETLAELMPMIEELLGQGSGLAALQELTSEQRDAIRNLQDRTGSGQDGAGPREETGPEAGAPPRTGVEDTDDRPGRRTNRRDR